jgi:hypothetical protein
MSVQITTGRKQQFERAPEVPMTLSRATLAAGTNATSITTKPTRVAMICVGNISASAMYLKIFDKASAPIVGTDVPILTVQCPNGSPVVLGVEDLGGLFCANGLAFAVTKAIQDLDTTAVAAGDVTPPAGMVITLGYTTA